MTNTYNIQKFDFNTMYTSSCINIIGKRASGKSTLCKDIIQHKNPTETFIFTQVQHDQEFYKDVVPNTHIINDTYDQFSNNIEKVVNILKNKVNITQKYNEKVGCYNDPEYIKNKYLIVIEDSMFWDTQLFKDKNIHNLFMNWRNLHTSLILLTQYSLSIPPVLRTNIDYTFIFKDNNITNRKKIHEHYAGMIPTFELFATIMNDCTKNYESIVIDNTTNSDKVEDIVFGYKVNCELPNTKKEIKKGHSNEVDKLTDILDAYTIV